MVQYQSEAIREQRNRQSRRRKGNSLVKPSKGGRDLSKQQEGSEASRASLLLVEL